MHRRDLLRFSILSFFKTGLVINATRLLALEATSWSRSVNGLRLGLRLQANGANSRVLVLLENVGPVRMAVFASLGLAKRFDFTATASDGKEYPIAQRATYTPCAGLCYWPIIDGLYPSQTMQLEFATKELIYIPERAPIVELGTLLSRGYSLRASFTVTDKDLQEALNQDLVEESWRGQVISPKVYFPDQKQ